MTPEGKIKSMINKVLAKHGVWVFMPVPSGFQATSIDYFCCYKGRFITIEAKAPGKKPTSRQEYVLGLIREHGGHTFVVDGDDALHYMDEVLKEMK